MSADPDVAVVMNRAIGVEHERCAGLADHLHEPDMQ